MSTLVEVRCRSRGCGRLLHLVDWAPAVGDDAEWAGWVAIMLCPRHGEGAGHGNVRAWQARQRRAGRDAGRVHTLRWLPWSELRPAVTRARRTGRTEVHVM